VVVESAAVKNHGGDVGGLRALGEELGDGLGPSTLPWTLDFNEASTDDAAARVTPWVSSMIWAEMCLLVRLTATRGRSGVPDKRLRMRFVTTLTQFSRCTCHYFAAFPALRATRSPR